MSFFALVARIHIVYVLMKLLDEANTLEEVQYQICTEIIVANNSYLIFG